MPAPVATEHAITVDHAVINVLSQMDEAAQRFAALGFHLTERGYHSLGSINHLMMFEHDYLELVGIEPGASKVRREVADSPIGLNGLVFKTGSAAMLHERLAVAGVPVLPPLDFDRPVEIDGHTLHAAFTTVRVEPGFIHGGRIYFCEHKTPELVWRPEWQQHANGAVALAWFVVVTGDPLAEAARYRAVLGEVPMRAPGHDAVELDIGDFRLKLWTPERYQSHYGAAACTKGSDIAFMGAVGIRTRSLARLRECLAAPAARLIAHEDTADGVIVPASQAYDCVLEFTR